MNRCMEPRDQIFQIEKELETFAENFGRAVAADSNIVRTLKEARIGYDMVSDSRMEKSRAAAIFISTVAGTVFGTHPNARSRVWSWDNLEKVATDALSRKGGPWNEVEHSARDSYVWLLRVGLAYLGAEEYEADELVVDTKVYYFSDEYLQEWTQSRFKRLEVQATESALLGPNGKTLASGSAGSESLIRTVNADFLKIFQGRAELLYKLNPRQFEEFIAELLIRLGYDVELTAATRDGGKDIYAAKKNLLGSFLYAVECKQNAPDNHVGVGVVRQLFGVVMKERVTAGILVTTSTFTADAIKFQGEVRHQVSLRDYLELKNWLKAARGEA
jgi:hypothetical protein